jgi:type I restriction enzyme S subunit
LNTTLWVKEFRRVTPIYAYYLLKDLDFSQFNSGAAVPTLNRNDVHGLPVIIPSKNILAKFDEFVLPIYEMRRNITTRNANLRRTRDLLLPRLVSGEVGV